MLSAALFFAIVSSGVLAQNNDWTKPCLDGECFWDIPASANVSGTMRVWGAPTAISDITTAAGWTILNCDPNALAQDIRLVCTGAASDCDHLFQGGATDTLVRLPTSCGASPFARVTRTWVHADQSLPANVARQLARRDDPAVVQGVAVDTNFDEADPVNGDVNVAISGTTVPGQTGNLTVTPPPAAPARRSRFQKRGLFSFIEDQFKKFNSFDSNVTKSLPPIDVDKSFPLFSQSISCPAPAVSASVSASVDAKAHAVISLGMSAVGKIIPPSLSEFGVFVGLDADLSGSMQLTGSATGSIDTGLIDVFSAGIPGLDFPGILTIGPTFKIQAQATATLDVNVDAKVVLAYHVENAKLFFPKSDSLTSGGTFNPADSPLSLSVAPSVASKGVVSAHVIPRLDLGVSGLAGTASATVFLTLDASASMTLSLDANATAGVSTTDPAAASANVNGCIDVGAGLAVTAGASADFFGLFDPNTKVNLFTKNFDLFKKCLGASTPARRDIVMLESSLTRRADLGCPAAIANLFKAVDEAVPAASIVGV
ncbi:hypothetical protein B0H17DRAFT_1031883 [Mycena rosella]|uniref:DUF7223 domain-containing protein n=1 Tax=Mycena rosella TaxID=1033263 RepID=A0AAD7GYN1_MYCRO|nr:hypothetical protein B0H17DRAFT_1031883 [Mycena rosella]